MVLSICRRLGSGRSLRHRVGVRSANCLIDCRRNSGSKCPCNWPRFRGHSSYGVSSWKVSRKSSIWSQHTDNQADTSEITIGSTESIDQAHLSRIGARYEHNWNLPSQQMPMGGQRQQSQPHCGPPVRPPVSSSSMRRGQRPTWPVPMAGGDAGSRSGLRSRTAIGVQ